MLSVQNQAMTSKISFKQNEENVTANRPFETHAGLKTGAVVGGIGAATTLSLYSLADKFVKAGQEIVAEVGAEAGEEAAHDAGNILSEAGASLKAAGKKLWFTVPISIAIYTGCGALMDKITNDRRAKFAKEIEGKDTKDILKDNPDAELTRKGEVYQKSNIGKKYGTLLGAVVMPLWSKASSMITKTRSPLGVISNVIIGALGGLMLGSISDHYSNKGAIKHADKMGV